MWINPLPEKCFKRIVIRSTWMNLKLNGIEAIHSNFHSFEKVFRIIERIQILPALLVASIYNWNYLHMISDRDGAEFEILSAHVHCPIIHYSQRNHIFVLSFICHNNRRSHFTFSGQRKVFHTKPSRCGNSFSTSYGDIYSTEFEFRARSLPSILSTYSKL